MNAKEFYELVVKMREAQKNYFRSRTQVYLKESKQHEKEVDKEIKRVQGVVSKRDNPTLFKE